MKHKYFLLCSLQVTCRKCKHGFASQLPMKPINLYISFVAIWRQISVHSFHSRGFHEACCEYIPLFVIAVVNNTQMFGTLRHAHHMHTDTVNGFYYKLNVREMSSLFLEMNLGLLLRLLNGLIVRTGVYACVITQLKAASRSCVSLFQSEIDIKRNERSF